MGYCKAHQLDMRGFCGKFDCPCIKHNCRFFGVKTNADRIRAMSDEELVALMKKIVSCADCPVGTKCIDISQKCEDLLLEWLKQPAEE